eukprot:CAMPEP_0170263712 /NCGR_PEP_ID=MMETSP0116_2-20130129/31745_1 /TAXON_ID=400756 /ORGANISM="Durinskia baltica, Strain CSIRO CS-38" /LENGTH=42 /DNA_ID= /DNA_START= /DNA_END= /DNA_ORIENTATION=
MDTGDQSSPSAALPGVRDRSSPSSPSEVERSAKSSESADVYS